MPWTAGKDAFKVATDLYYVNVQILGANGRPIEARLVEVPRFLVRCVGVAFHGSSGHGCRG